MAQLRRKIITVEFVGLTAVRKNISNTSWIIVMKLQIAFAFGVAFVLSPLASVSTANACTNSYDTAKDGSNCGGRAAGCKQGGRSGNC
jgi:hypothetical protein